MMNNGASVTMRLPAEWEYNQSVIIAIPHASTDWLPIIDEVKKCYVDMIKAIAPQCNILALSSDIIADTLMLSGDSSIDRSRLFFLPVPTNDTWTRDYGFITTVDNNGNYHLNDFKFNGWGLKFAADKDNLVNLQIAVRNGIAIGNYINRLGFVLEGGSIESDGKGTLMTTSRCLLSPNRNGEMTKEEIEAYLTKCFNLKQILWLDHGALEGDDTDSHIDTLARFAPNDTILYVACDDSSDTHYAELKLMRKQLEGFTTVEGAKFNLIPLPFPTPIYDEDGYRLPATYANFLVTPGVVVVPTYNQPEKDQKAMELIAGAFPDYTVRGVDCTALIKQHGSLHCATMQTSDKVIPHPLVMT